MSWKGGEQDLWLECSDDLWEAGGEFVCLHVSVVEACACMMRRMVKKTMRGLKYSTHPECWNFLGAAGMRAGRLLVVNK